jgi:hypothetical protein
MKSLKLATSICSCPEVDAALGNKSHPCNRVVSVQDEMVATDVQMRQRPEPWIGNIETARVLFLSSNPGLSDDPKIAEREDFPTYKVSDEVAGNFFVNRFNQENTPVHATFNHPTEPNFLVRCVDGNYRSGMKQQKRPQATWQGIHDHAMAILGDKCDPNQDYALTEIVHCKSKMAAGVEEASSHCVDKWLLPIFELSQAKIVFVMGSKVRDFFAIPLLEFSQNFGSDKNKVYRSLSQRDRALRDIQISDFGGTKRLYVYCFHPTHAISPNTIEAMFGAQMLNWFRSLSSGQAQIPQTAEELTNLINTYTN